MLRRVSALVGAILRGFRHNCSIFRHIQWVVLMKIHNYEHDARYVQHEDDTECLLWGIAYSGLMCYVENRAVAS